MAVFEAPSGAVHRSRTAVPDRRDRDGVVVTNFPKLRAERALDVQLDSSGRLIVGGYGYAKKPGRARFAGFSASSFILTPSRCLLQLIPTHKKLLHEQPVIELYVVVTAQGGYPIQQVQQATQVYLLCALAQKG